MIEEWEAGLALSGSTYTGRMRRPSLTMRLIYGRFSKSDHCGMRVFPHTQSNCALALSWKRGFLAKKRRFVSVWPVVVSAPPWWLAPRIPELICSLVKEVSGWIDPSRRRSASDSRMSPFRRLASTSSRACANTAVVSRYVCFANSIEPTKYSGMYPKK
jgi:hypothetical protein